MNPQRITPGYIALHESGELEKRISLATERLSSCCLCPRCCKVNRLEDEKGFCKTGRQAKISSYSPHFGEESPLVGAGGSGTIFITYCNLGCVFCQNYEISHGGEGVSASAGQIAAIMISLQKQGCHNINFVTPSHVVPQILEALPTAIDKGLTIPLVYNSSGYDSLETLKLLDGVIDIYMPDFKFSSPNTADQLCKAKDYPQRARQAIKEMHRQVGDLKISKTGLALKGLLIRHLVMPDGLEETKAITEFIANDISPNTYVNIMEQYRPCGEARKHPSINRMLTNEEYKQAVDIAREAGLKRLDDRNLERMLRRLGIL